MKQIHRLDVAHHRRAALAGVLALCALLPAAAAAQQLQLPVRGSRTAGLWVTAATQKVVLLKRDLNIYAGADVLSYSITDASGAPLHSGSLPDDGVTTKGGGAGTLQHKTLNLSLAPGYHQLKLTSAGSDAVFDLQATGALVMWRGGALMLNDAKMKGSLYLRGPAGGGVMTLGTWHTGGNNQTVTLWQGAKQLSSVAISKTHVDVKLAVPAAAAGQALELRVPKMDIYISSKEVEGYAASPKALLPAGGLDLVYPLAQARAVLPGYESMFQLRLRNPGVAPLTMTFTAPKPKGGFTLKLAPGEPSKVTVAPGQEALLLLVLTCASGTKVGAAATFHLGVSTPALGGLPMSARVDAATGYVAVTKKARPFLFYSDAEIAAAKARAADPKTPWAKAALDALVKYADIWLTLPISVPTGEGAWSGFYVCPSGPSLTYDRASPKKHLCKADGKLYTGQPYDGAWLTRRHNELAKAARTLGLVYRLTGKQVYAKRAAVILAGFTRVYMSHRFHDNRYGSSAETKVPSKSAGRLMSQTLSESSWLVGVLAAYDAVAKTLGPGARADVENNLLRQAVAVVQRYDAGKSNWQAWHNAAIGAAGYCLAEQKWVTAALSGGSGFAYQMKVSKLMPDGFWYEGSIGYHLYTLGAYRWLALAARHHGVDLYKQGLLDMVHAPVLMAFPDASFPKLNDGGTGGLSSMRGALEAAAALANDKQARAVLRTLYDDLKQARSSEEALLLGPSLGSGAGLTLAPKNFSATGYAVLRGGAGAGGLYAGLDYGPHGHWHGHSDKLQLILFGAGALLLPDMGTTAYRLPYHAGFFKQTLSHNTVMLDQVSQADGKETPRVLDAFRSLALSKGGPGLGLTRATVGSDVFGAGNSVRRTVLLVGGDYAVDHAAVTAPKAKTVDLLFHGYGALAVAGDTGRGSAAAHTGGWKASKAGHAYLGPPTLGGSAAKSVITGLLPAAKPVTFTWSRGASVSHPMDSTEGLSGGKLETKDKVQGTASLRWEPDNDGKAQFITRTYTHPKLELSSFDTLEFWAKVSAPDLKWFGVKVYDLPTYDQAVWRLDAKGPVPANKWIKYTLNLKKPDALWGGTKSVAEQIVFRLQGSGKGAAKITVLLDGLVARKGGKAEVATSRGLRLEAFGGKAGEPGRYLAASAPSNPPTTTHPMIMLRATGGSAGYLSVLRPFDGAAPVKASARLAGGGVSVPLDSGGEDWLALDKTAASARWARHGKGGALQAAGMLGASLLERPGRLRLSAAKAGDVVLQVTGPGALRYVAVKAAPLTLRWPVTGAKVTATVDGKAWAKVKAVTAGGKAWAELSGLPDGEHLVTVGTAPAADAGPPDAAPDLWPPDKATPAADSGAPDLPSGDVSTPSVDSGADVGAADDAAPGADGGEEDVSRRGCTCGLGQGHGAGLTSLCWLLFVLAWARRRRRGTP